MRGYSDLIDELIFNNVTYVSILQITLLAPKMLFYVYQIVFILIYSTKEIVPVCLWWTCWVIFSQLPVKDWIYSAEGSVMCRHNTSSPFIKEPFWAWMSYMSELSGLYKKHSSLWESLALWGHILKIQWMTHSIVSVEICEQIFEWSVTLFVFFYFFYWTNLFPHLTRSSTSQGPTCDYDHLGLLLILFSHEIKVNAFFYLLCQHSDRDLHAAPPSDYNVDVVPTPKLQVREKSSSLKKSVPNFYLNLC